MRSILVIPLIACVLSLVAFFICLLPTKATADPCTGEPEHQDSDGAGGSLVPVSQQNVVMVSERVEFMEDSVPAKIGLMERNYLGMTISGYPRWTVRAHYVFKNLSKRSLPLKIIFPMKASYAYEVPCIVPIYNEDYDDYDDEYYEEDDGEEDLDYDHQEPPADNFVVKVNGAVVPHSLQRDISATEAGTYDYGYVFDTEFAGGSTTEMDIEYVQEPWTGESYSYGRVSDVTVDFILKTGRLWKGSIGQIELVYRFAIPTKEAFVGDIGAAHKKMQALRLGQGTVKLWESTSFDYELSCSSGTSTLRMVGKNVEPDGDISLWVDEPVERLHWIEARGCQAWDGRPSIEQDCCPFLKGPTLAEEMIDELGTADRQYRTWTGERGLSQSTESESPTSTQVDR